MQKLSNATSIQTPNSQTTRKTSTNSITNETSSLFSTCSSEFFQSNSVTTRSLSWCKKQTQEFVNILNPRNYLLTDGIKINGWSIALSNISLNNFTQNMCYLKDKASPLFLLTIPTFLLPTASAEQSLTLEEAEDKINSLKDEIIRLTLENSALKSKLDSSSQYGIVSGIINLSSSLCNFSLSAISSVFAVTYKIFVTSVVVGGGIVIISGLGANYLTNERKKLLAVEDARRLTTTNAINKAKMKIHFDSPPWQNGIIIGMLTLKKELNLRLLNPLNHEDIRLLDEITLATKDAVEERMKAQNENRVAVS